MGALKDAIMSGPEKQIQMPEFIEKQVECKKHGKYLAHIVTIPGTTKEVYSRCPECEKLDLEIERYQRHLQLEQQLNVNAVFKNSCIPTAFQGKSFKTWHPANRKAVEVRDLMARLVKEFGRAKSMGTCFLFSGNTRTGKTSLACAVLNNIMRLGHTGAYINSLHYISQVKRSWVSGSELSEDQIIESYVLPFELLVIDELGKGNLTPKEKGIIFRLIDRRAEENLPTIGITKFSEQQLVKLIDDDIVARLKRGGGSVLKFDWPNYEDQQERF
jgi:DNA replication protein DnaC